MSINSSPYKEEQEKKKREKKLKELYTRYNQCRDAELDRFWKNSVFVWVFLALCFTGLGILVKDYNMPTKAMCVEKKISSDDYYLLLSIISGIGLILSNIWVWMARGLKAWYEVFELAIWQMETKDNIFEYPTEYTIDKFWIIKGNANPFQEASVSSAPISTSKIVILIGRLLVLFWGCLFVYFLCKYSKASFWCYSEWILYSKIYGWCVLWYAFNFKLWGSIVIVSVILFLGKLFVQSSTLLTDGEKEVCQLIENEIVIILKQKNNITITQEDTYRFVFQNTFETIENKIKNCISFVATKNNNPITVENKNLIYNSVLKKITKLNDYGIVNEVVSELSKNYALRYSIKLSIVRFFYYRRFNVDIKIDNTHKHLLNLDKDFEVLKAKVKSQYFTITKVKKVNENRIKVRCRAIHKFRDLFNCDIYNLHNEESLINN